MHPIANKGETFYIVQNNNDSRLAMEGIEIKAKVKKEYTISLFTILIQVDLKMKTKFKYFKHFDISYTNFKEIQK